ncbi:MAG TPA: acetyl-CoA C-acyltransferase [Steroidobacteraceae bacterium]
MSREAVIIATARTPIGKAYRGAFNDTDATTLGGHVVAAAVSRAGIDAAQIDDVVFGCAVQQGTTGQNIARYAALRAGLPMSVAGMTIDRACSSGLMAVATAAKQIVVDGADVTVGGGVESVSLVMNERLNNDRVGDAWQREHIPELDTSMIETAEIVAERYGVSREAQDRYALQSQQRTAEAQAAGRYDAEIAPLSVQMRVQDKSTGAVSRREVTLRYDEGNRPGTTLEDLQRLQPVFKGGRYVAQGKYVTAGNASQLSDGAAAMVLVERKLAERRGFEPLGAYRGMAVAGCRPEEMGIGPVFAVPKLLARHGLGIDDIGLWELNEAFASQLLYCRDQLGIPDERLNVSGGSIAIGHPFGMTGARCIGHLLHEGRRRRVKYGIVTMCVGGGMGAAGLFEIYPPSV